MKQTNVKYLGTVRSVDSRHGSVGMAARVLFGQSEFQSPPWAKIFLLQTVQTSSEAHPNFRSFSWGQAVSA